MIIDSVGTHWKPTKTSRTLETETVWHWRPQTSGICGPDLALTARIFGPDLALTAPQAALDFERQGPAAAVAKKKVEAENSQTRGTN